MGKTACENSVIRKALMTSGGVSTEERGGQYKMEEVKQEVLVQN